MMFREIYWVFKSKFRRDKCCGSKIGFPNKRSALRAKTSMEKKRTPKKFDAYFCPWCWKYHIGKSVVTTNKENKKWF